MREKVQIWNGPTKLEGNRKTLAGLPAKMQAQVDTLCLLAKPKEGQQQFKNKKQPELTGN